jgi:single-strand DNA-binding protein
MNGYAVVNMAGALTDAPELRYRTSGVPVASFRVAVGRTVRTEFHERKWTDYLDCVNEGEEAEEIARSFKRGDNVDICGLLIQQRWEDRGHKKSRMVVNVVTISMVVKIGDVKEISCA